MRYEQKAVFVRSLKRFPTDKKQKVKEAIAVLIDSFETKRTPHGLGLKCLRKNLWEIRAGIKTRVIFQKSDDLVEFIIAGDHDDVKNFLKNI